MKEASARVVVASTTTSTTAGTKTTPKDDVNQPQRVDGVGTPPIVLRTMRDPGPRFFTDRRHEVKITNETATFESKELVNYGSRATWPNFSRKWTGSLGQRLLKRPIVVTYVRCRKCGDLGWVALPPGAPGFHFFGKPTCRVVSISESVVA